ncbi:MAG: 5'-methylthioadenosine/adenosylhomocysteine nucleosidase [Rhodoferax sp.]|uniref:5'-methylthioadenosine/adenosylhomocysteine nucleosidase n=1 Tax=Rhodoferax sp. TaxID=50421 RepID=UPI0032675C87
MTLAILSALAEEQQGIFEQLDQPQRVQHAGRSFGLGRWHGQPVVLALSRIGKVAAATTATTLIERFGVQRIVFTGVAGGVGAGVQVGDVVVASEYLQHDMHAEPLFPAFEVPLYGRARFACDNALTAILLEAARAGVTSAGGLFPLNPAPQVHQGLVASGDLFVSSAAQSQALLAALNASGHEALAVEMEGAAVAQVCHDYGVPFAAMRTISDRADDSAHVDFPEFVRTVASRYAQAILTEFVQRL